MVDNSYSPTPIGVASRTTESQQLMLEILTVATRLIRKKGILGTTVEDLVEAVGIPKGTLYYHIGTKAELLYRIHEHVTDEGFIRWQGILEATEGQSAKTVLERMIHEHCVIIEEYRDWIAVFTEEMKFLSPELQAQIKVRRREYQQLLESVLERGVAEGVFSDRPIHLTASVIIGTLNSMYRWYTPEGRLGPRAMGRLVSSVIMEGVRNTEQG
jgi:AcrR family transcriptional regulator